MFFVQQNAKPAELIIPVVDSYNRRLFFTGHNGINMIKPICTGPAKTAPYRFGQRFDILGVSLRNDCRNVDPAFCVELIYFTVNDVLYCINVEGDDRNSATISLTGVERMSTIRLYSDHIHTANMFPFNGGPQPEMEGGFISFAIRGSIDVDTGVTAFDGEVLVNNLNSDVKIELKGYTLKAFYAEV